MKKLVPKSEKPTKKPKASKTGVKNRPKKSVSKKTSAEVCLENIPQSDIKPKMGKPPQYTDVELFSNNCDEYFDICDRENRPYTIPGLAYHLGFIDRHAVINYQGKPDFAATVKKARMRIERQRIEKLVSGQGSCPGQIFDLKNNFDYKDKSEVDQNSKISFEDSTLEFLKHVTDHGKDKAWEK